MVTLIVCLAAILAVLVVSEYGWRRKLLIGERGRKFVHILVGCFVAFWPWLMSWRQIQLVGVVFLLAVIINKRLKIFHAIFSIKRRSVGEETFAAAVSLSAIVTHNKIFFMIAMLHLALADGVAALVGRKVNKKWRYSVFGQTKTVLGSMAFWLTSIWILGLGLLQNGFGSYPHYTAALIIIPPVVTLIENIVPWGLDNIVLPLSVICLLAWFA